MVLSLPVVLLFLSASMVTSMRQDEAFLNYTVTSQNEDVDESIDVNYRRKYVIISTPAHRDAREVAMFHDYNQGFNLMKRNGQCFVIHGFDGIPENIKDWEKVQKGAVNKHVGEVTQYRAYMYRRVSVTLNRTTLPEAAQEFCSGLIGLVVVEDVVDGDEALEEPRGQLGDNKDVREIFVPGQLSRVKRGWIRSVIDWVKKKLVELLDDLADGLEPETSAGAGVLPK